MDLFFDPVTALTKTGFRVPTPDKGKVDTSGLDPLH
jgi:hypothetical protein